MRTLAWPMTPGEVDTVFQALRFGHCKWDIYHRGQGNILPDAIVLSRAEHAALTTIAQGVWQALRAVEAGVVASADALAAVGVPEALHEAIVNQYAGPRRVTRNLGVTPSPRVTRCDFHLAVGGDWLISEFNEDGPGGYAECMGLQTVLTEHWVPETDGLAFAGDLQAALTTALAPWPSIGLVYATGYSEDLQQVALVADWLRQAGHTAVMGSPANLLMRSGRAMLFDQPVDALFRYYPGEWLGELPNAADWFEACAAMPMMNALSALVAQSKRFYAAPLEHDLPLSAAARTLLADHVPCSYYLTAGRREQLIAERERWVLKGAFGRMGDAVRLGIGYSAGDWVDVVDRALREADQFALQQRFDPVPLWFSNGLGYATIGMFLVNGRFAGYYSRVSRYPVINYDSCHVATLVETA